MMANGLVIAAPRTGSGKTLLTLGLARALSERGLAIAPAKTGPDYIDAALLTAAAGREAINLDPWAMSPARLRGLAARHAEAADLLLVEGVMGLFDGAANGLGSTADLAAILGLPVILVVDAERQGQSIAALAHGFATWRSDIRLAGLILNRVGSARHEAILRAALASLPIPLLGALPRQDALILPDRHLGLVLPAEIAGFDAVLATAAASVRDHIDLDALLAISQSPPPLLPPPEGGRGEMVPDIGREGSTRSQSACLTSPTGGEVWMPRNPGEGTFRPLPPLGQRIAIARDDAFAFLYPHWLADWRAWGATLSFFSPLADEAPDPSADAVFLPGGYPELHAARLANAGRFLDGLRAAAGRGALLYGECGGYMVLGTAMTDAQGNTHTMAGLLPHRTRIDRPKRTLGYRQLRHASPLPFPTALAGHEFHYSDADPVPGTPLFTATDALGSPLPPMGHVAGRVMGSYAHVIDVAPET